MSLLRFEAAGQRYGLDIADVVEIVPAVELRPVPHAPAYLSGLLQYRGEAVPVVDLSRLMGGPPAAPRFSTRIVIVTQAGADGGRRLLGLVAEHATDAADVVDTSAEVPSGVAIPEAPYLGDLSSAAGGLIQRLRVDHVLSDEVRAMLALDA
jgi:chemotaxis-related protein WspB